MRDPETLYSIELTKAPPTLVVNNGDGRPLVTLTFTADGHLTADYDPADLDEAAQIFFTRVAELTGRAVTS